jgi:hypothetical protein
MTPACFITAWKTAEPTERAARGRLGARLVRAHREAHAAAAPACGRPEETGDAAAPGPLPALNFSRGASAGEAVAGADEA